MREEKIQLVAVSYDDVKTLFEFGKAARIDFALLSDPKSKTIDAYGMRNREAKGSRIDGVPHPATFLVGQDGIVHAKLLYPDYKERHQAKDIVEASKELPRKKAA